MYVMPVTDEKDVIWMRTHNTELLYPLVAKHEMLSLSHVYLLYFFGIPKMSLEYNTLPSSFHGNLIFAVVMACT